MFLPGHLPSSLESGVFVGLGFFYNHRVSGFSYIFFFSCASHKVAFVMSKNVKPSMFLPLQYKQVVFKKLGGITTSKIK